MGSKREGELFSSDSMQTSAVFLAILQTRAYEPSDLEDFVTVQNYNWSSLLTFFLVF